jgi:hypothetical protein
METIQQHSSESTLALEQTEKRKKNRKSEMAAKRVRAGECAGDLDSQLPQSERRWPFWPDLS